MPDATAITMSDAQPKPGPALSATSDAPVIDPSNALPNEEAPAAVVEPTEIKTAEELAAEAAEGKEPKTPKEDKTDPAVKAVITKERNRARKAEDALVAERAEKAQLAAALEAATKKPDPVPLDKPKRETFDNPDAYETAYEAWAAERAEVAAKEAVNAERTKQQNDMVAQQATKLINDFGPQIETFKVDHPDFDDVFNDDLPINLAMTTTLINAEKGAELAYWLGQNPEEAKRISQLSDVRAVYELGRIEARLASAAEATPVAKPKPAPIRALSSGRTGSTGRSVDEMSTEEYAAHRNAQLKGGGGAAVH